jgi:hypothetical protein
MARSNKSTRTKQGRHQPPSDSNQLSGMARAPGLTPWSAEDLAPKIALSVAITNSVLRHNLNGVCAKLVPHRGSCLTRVPLNAIRRSRGEVRKKRALNCWPWERSLTHSSAAMVAAWATKVMTSQEAADTPTVCAHGNGQDGMAGARAKQSN